jgi:hypothetical protein
MNLEFRHHSIAPSPIPRSSAFGIVITRLVDDKIQVFYPEKFQSDDLLALLSGIV